MKLNLTTRRRNFTRLLAGCLTLLIAFLGAGNKCPPLPEFRGDGQSIVLPEICGSFDRRFYQSGFADDSFYQTVAIAAVAMDAKGNIFVGGRFTSVDNVDAYNIARYDTATDTWSPLAGEGLRSGFGPETVVNALAISGDYLYVGGRFTQTEDGTVTNMHNVARYDINTESWSPLTHNGLNTTVRALAVSGNDLFVGGDFTQTQNGAANLVGVARYNQTSAVWSPLAGGGLSFDALSTGSIHSLAADGAGGLFVGGSFAQTHDGSVTNLNNVARYNVAVDSWSALAGGGLYGGPVSALLIHGSEIFVGGNFSRTFDGATNLANVARYDRINNSWTAFLAGGLNGVVRAFAVVGNELFIGGDFTATANGGIIRITGIASYELPNAGWSSLAGGGLSTGTSPGTVGMLFSAGGRLFVGGNFKQTDDINMIVRNLNHIARYEPLTDTWSPLGADDGLALDDGVTAVAYDPTNNDIYVGGDFTQTANRATTNLNYIARFDNATNTWTALANGGLNGNVSALVLEGNYLYVGGAFTQTADGAVTNLNHVARYDISANSWSPLANGGLDSYVSSMAISGTRLYVGGSFSQSHDGAVTDLRRIARYDTGAGSWSALSNGGLNSGVTALAVSGSRLFAGGFFTATHDNAVTNLNHIASYDTGTNSWSALAHNGLNNYVFSLAASDNLLFANGAFSETHDGSISFNQQLAHYNAANDSWAIITGGAHSLSAAYAVRAIKSGGNNRKYVMAAVGHRRSYCGSARHFTRGYLNQFRPPAPFSAKGFSLGGADGADWHDDANWTSGDAPNAGEDAVIPAGAGPINITSADVTLKDLMVNGGTLTVAANRTLTVNGILALEGGAIIVGAGTIVINNCRADGIMLGKTASYVRTALTRCVNGADTFNFPVGTENGYSPVTIKNVTGAGYITVRANQGAYPNAANGLPANRVSRWWQIENPGGGVTGAEVLFNYLQTDVIGNENNYRAFRIANGSAAAASGASNPFANRVTAQNVTSFSDWALAELAPTAANVTVAGRVKNSNGKGIMGASVTLTDGGGNTRNSVTNFYGYYQLTEIPAGQTYVISARSKWHQFAQPTLVLFVGEDLTQVDFIAAP